MKPLKKKNRAAIHALPSDVMQAPRAVLTCTENTASFEALVSFAPWVAAAQRGSASLSRTEAPTRMSGVFLG